MNRELRVLLFSVLLSPVFAFSQGQPSAAPAEPRIPIPISTALPQWPRPHAFVPQTNFPSVRSSELEVIYGKAPLDGFLVRVNGHLMGVGGLPSKVGYVVTNEVHWMEAAAGTLHNPSVAVVRNQIEVSYESIDPDGATWRIAQRIRPQRVAGTLEVQTDITVDQPRAVALIPVFLLFPGVDAFHTNKEQALFAGLEYLENEPSSSEADVIGPASNRKVPDSTKITFPLMAIAAEGNYLGLTWQMRPQFSPFFDSPDRTFNSGAHSMGLLFPGSNPKSRVEGNVFAKTAEWLHPREILSARAMLLGGTGNTVVPAVQQYLKTRPLPSLPAGPGEAEYVKGASTGWLKTPMREGNLVRHALAAGAFKPQPAADAALWMKWLALHNSDVPTQTELEQTATNVLSAVRPEQYNSAGVGHIRYPVECLVFGDVARNVDQAAQRARSLLPRFTPDGSVKYLPTPGQTDLGKTHFTNEASGLASKVVLDLLEAAVFCGQTNLIDLALQHLNELDRFQNGVPRGAQTWECPLHTPDILASAQMVRAYTLGYQLTGETHFLDQARYWAWTGVPFVYLVNPTEAPVGMYATIAVYGATQWRAPVWFGLPVQWCGLVYADALYRLVRVDAKGPWKQLADGITISAMQQSWPAADPQFAGLLPDSFVLQEQKRNGPAINPATLGACVAEYLKAPGVYDLHCFRSNHLIAHAPGEIQFASEAKDRVSFQVETWLKDPFYVMVNGVTHEPKVKVDGKSVDEKTGNKTFVEAQGLLILKLQRGSAVEIDL